MKTCFKCGVEKPRTDFYKHSRMADGLLGKCKECTKADVKDHREQNIEAVRQYDRVRGRTDERKARIRSSAWKYADAKAEYQRKSRAQNPEKHKARKAVGNALRDGKLVKDMCAICSHPETEAHHPDYSRPLDVVWLCRTHHGHAHRID